MYVHTTHFRTQLMMELQKSMFIVSVLLACILGRAGSTSSTVIVVGAGASGIAAATRLLEKGITNITVLEAEPRIGGRIHSASFGGSLVDLGAEFTGKFNGGVVFDMVENYDVLHKFNMQNSKFCYSNKEEIDDEFSDTMVVIMNKVFNGEDEAPEGISIGEHYMKIFNESISELHLSDAKQINFVNDFVDFLRYETLCEEGSTTWDESPAKNENWMGNDYFSFTSHGFKTILEILMDKYPKSNETKPIDEKILLKKEVTKIIWDNNAHDGVTVKCADGTTYHSDYVIFTPSLGVMKKQHADLFEPHLPQSKVNAIEKLGTGPVMKFAMHFENQWWPQPEFAINLIWTKDDKEALKNDGKLWLVGFVGMYTTLDTPNILSGFVSGEAVADVENFDDKTFQDEIMFVLTKFLEPKYNVSQPVAVIRSKWYTNPHFRGVYMHETLETRRDKMNGIDHIRELGKPLRNENCKVAVLFAGDVTHLKLYGSVDGAIARGHSEAEKVYHLLQINEY